MSGFKRACQSIRALANLLANLLAIVACAAAMAADPAADPPAGPGWPQWRGPTLDAISTERGLADAWPDGGPPVLWSRELGQGYSSFIAVGPHVFTQTQSLYEQSVVCLDAETGQTVWSARTGWPYEGGGLYPGPRSTPAWHAGRVYYATPDGTIGCLNGADGAAVWSTNPTKQFRGRGTDFGYSCSPLVIDGKVIVPVGGFGASVVALDASDGSLVWKGGDSSASYASPLPIVHRGQPLILVLLENSLAAFDLKSGLPRWEIDLSEGYDEHSAAPLYQEPLLMIAGPFRSGAKCLRLQADPADTPVRVWDSPRFSNDVASSVLFEGRVYGFDLRDPQSRVNRPSRGEYRCLEFATGKILWSTDKLGHANTIVADGKLILFNDRGEVILARAGSDQYEELARAEVFQDEICWSPPALDRGRLYLRTQSRAVCLYLGRSPLKTEQPAQTIAAIPRTRRAFDPTPWLGGEREYPATTPEWFEFRHWYLWSLAGLGLATGVAWATLAVSLCLVPRTTSGPASAETSADASTAVAPAPASPVQPPVHSWRRLVSPASASRFAFWLTTLTVGVVGSPLLNRWQTEYVFLWPLVLWSVLQLTVLAIVWAERQQNRRRARWVSRLTGFAFLGVNGLYFHLCRRMGLSIEWGFLTGLLPAFPVAALAAQLLARPIRCRWLAEPVCAIVSFSAFFAAGMLFIKWWLRVGS